MKKKLNLLIPLHKFCCPLKTKPHTITHQNTVNRGILSTHTLQIREGRDKEPLATSHPRSVSHNVTTAASSPSLPHKITLHAKHTQFWKLCTARPHCNAFPSSYLLLFLSHILPSFLLLFLVQFLIIVTLLSNSLPFP